jgi:hypothetical protein
MRYYYTAYGLNIVSKIELPELMPRIEPEQLRPLDIEIVDGNIEIKFDGPIISRPFFQASQTDCLLSTPEGSQYWLHNGNRVVININQSGLSEIVRYFLIYGALPILLIQRGIFLLHGSAISNGQHALVLLGGSRSGKSTLAAGSWQRGWRLISDELIVCTLDPAQRICVQPGIPQILLWRDALDQLKMDYELAKPTRIPNQFILGAGEKFEQKPVPIQTIFCLERQSNKAPQPDVSWGHTKFLQVLQKTYLPHFPRPQAIHVKQAQIPMMLAATIPLKTILWTSHDYRVDNLLDKLLEQIK